MTHIAICPRSLLFVCAGRCYGTSRLTGARAAKPAPG